MFFFSSFKAQLLQALTTYPSPPGYPRLVFLVFSTHKHCQHWARAVLRWPHRYLTLSKVLYLPTVDSACHSHLQLLQAPCKVVGLHSLLSTCPGTITTSSRDLMQPSKDCDTPLLWWLPLYDWYVALEHPEYLWLKQFINYRVTSATIITWHYYKEPSEGWEAEH